MLVGRCILRLPRIGSTNDLAAVHAADPAAEGLVILADEQSQGRGQPGREWFAPPGTALLMSVVLQPPPELCRPVLLTALAAVAVCETVYSITHRQARIKWPNDVLLSGRKVCGILIEQYGPGVVLGLGLNLSVPTDAFAAAGLLRAGSLADFTAVRPSRDRVLGLLLAALDQRYDELCRGQPEEIESLWRWYSGLMGREVEVRTARGNYRGRLATMSFDQVVVVAGTNQHHTWYPEEIRALDRAPASE
jgi:BirA family biotin operon repressor/biotin-[acetyl-CoA-carboxylase] ligase